MLVITGCDEFARRNAKFNEIRNSLVGVNEKAADKFSCLMGSFSVSEMKTIAKALENDAKIDDHEISPKLREKLLMLRNDGMFE